MVPGSDDRVAGLFDEDVIMEYPGSIRVHQPRRNCGHGGILDQRPVSGKP
ncbi:uncharacterized protein METZ01_LOCUS276212 [marine metagenome]|uniref:Uncharacterized protein n=1 Tax=marine metagenome TaxID=408172 RepID=A0A382KG48_9ZZZZ